jgi:hypothetical protein
MLPNLQRNALVNALDYHFNAGRQVSLKETAEKFHVNRNTFSKHVAKVKELKLTTRIEYIKYVDDIRVGRPPFLSPISEVWKIEV